MPFLISRSRLTRSRLTRMLAPTLGLAVSVGTWSACTRETAGVPPSERTRIADSLTSLVAAAYDFSRPDVPAALLSLYPDSGRVISAAAGNVMVTRDSLASAIRGFWSRVGHNMQQPTFVIGSTYVDVITRDAVVMTLTYRIPHTTPAGNPHIVGGAWTMFWRRIDGRWQIVQEHLSDTPESTASTMPDSMAMQMPTPTPPTHQH